MNVPWGSGFETTSGAIRVFPRGAAFDVPDAFRARSGMLGEEPSGLRLRNGPATDVADKDRASQIAELLTVHTGTSALDGSDGSPALRPANGLFGASGLGLGGGRRSYREASLPCRVDGPAPHGERIRAV